MTGEAGRFAWLELMVDDGWMRVKVDEIAREIAKSAPDLSFDQAKSCLEGQRDNLDRDIVFKSDAGTIVVRWTEIGTRRLDLGDEADDPLRWADWRRRSDEEIAEIRNKYGKEGG